MKQRANIIEAGLEGPSDLTTIVVMPTTAFSVTREALSYQGLDGIVHQLIFAESRAHWIAYLNRSPEFPGSDRTIADSRGVGWHDFGHRPPYIDIFGEPRTRFVFSAPASWRAWLWWKLRYPSFSPHAAFQALHELITAAGWRLYDLS